MYLKGQKLEVALHSLHREYKNLQKIVLTNVKIQRTGKTSLQMFVYFPSLLRPSALYLFPVIGSIYIDY